MTRYIITTLFIIMSYALISQGTTSAKIKQADALMNSYINAASFKDGFSSGKMSGFEALFIPESRIVFDVPFRNTIEQNLEIQQISKDDREKSTTINIYGKQVSLTLYMKILAIEAERFGISTINSTTKLTGKKDISLLQNDTLIYEVSKQFNESDWFVEKSANYLIYISFLNGSPRISGIKINDENVSQSDVSFTFVDASSKGKNDKGYLIPNITTQLHIDFNEAINSKTISGVSDSSGQIIFERTANKDAIVFIDTAYSENGIQYEIPFDWRNDGKKVRDQPLGGFTVGLRPYKWNGLTYTAMVTGGVFIPENPDETNFNPNFQFNSQLGIKLGLSFNLSYFFNHSQWKVNPKVWLIGIGSGVSIDYQHATIKSDVFEQLPYSYEDEDSEECKVVFIGNNFSETNTLIALTFPIFVELKRKVGKKSSLSIKVGSNFTLPVSGNFKASGTFSRWGYYSQYGTNPLKNDDTLNYFTDKEMTFNGEVDYNPILAEGFLKLNWLLNVFNKNPDNSLEIGLEFALPFTSSTSYNYQNGKTEGYNDGYRISTENNDYHSLAYSTDKIYQYYFGISVGINLIKYRPR